jgi:cytoskeletal protein RodZ
MRVEAHFLKMVVVNQTTETMATTKSNTKEAPAKKKATSASDSKTTSKAKTESTTKKPAASTKSQAATKSKTSTKSETSGKSQASSKSQTSTRDHDTIRSWVEKRGGVPSMVEGTSSKGGDAGILRIDFPGYSGEGSLKQISWEAFFAKFDESKLEFLYQEKTADGKESRFNKFVSSN